MARPNSNDYLRPSVTKGADNASFNLANAHKMANQIEQSMRRQSDSFHAAPRSDVTTPEPQ